MTGVTALYFFSSRAEDPVAGRECPRCLRLGRTVHIILELLQQLDMQVHWKRSLGKIFVLELALPRPIAAVQPRSVSLLTESEGRTFAFDPFNAASVFCVDPGKKHENCPEFHSRT
jgi:hypothetical protein